MDTKPSTTQKGPACFLLRPRKPPSLSLRLSHIDWKMIGTAPLYFELYAFFTFIVEGVLLVEGELRPFVGTELRTLLGQTPSTTFRKALYSNVAVACSKFIFGYPCSTRFTSCCLESIVLRWKLAV